MGNLNFALFTAAYIYIVGWVFTKSRSFECLIVFALALSPMVALGLALQGRAVKQKNPDEVSPNAWIAHGLALAASIGLMIFVNSALTRESSMLFFMDYLKGWTMDDAIIVLLISAAMGAAAAVVWTTYRFRMTRNEFLRDKAPYVFFAGAPEPTRLLLYMYIFAFAWALGVAAVALAFGGILDVAPLILKLARACLPLALMLVVAMFRLPFMGIGLLVSLAGVWYLAAENTDVFQASVFVGVPLAALTIYFAAKAAIISAEGKNPETVAQVEAEQAAGKEKE